ncbi:MAG: IclR family transcriptional regulator, partial [Planctomycetota bacterium]
MIQSLQRAHAILAAVRARPDGIGIRELGRELGLHAATVSNLVRSLHALGYLHADSNRRYHIGVQAAWPGNHDEALPHLAALAEAHLRVAVGEHRTSELSVLRGLRRQTVMVLRAGEPPELPGQHNDDLPLHDTTIGRVLLAWAPSDLRSDYLSVASFSQGPHRISDADELRVRLEVVRSLGYAQSDQTPLGRHLIGIAMPIRDPRGQAIAACNLHLPKTRAQADEADQLHDALDTAISGMRRTLGW